ncbi:hypothetical protein L208DRAFT_1381176 [Tricholoma matsutake]|nr:hypothetical protein L208DRAFT_1381176 [Tricholoma matsutake 945]
MMPIQMPKMKAAALPASTPSRDLAISFANPDPTHLFTPDCTHADQVKDMAPDLMGFGPPGELFNLPPSPSPIVHKLPPNTTSVVPHALDDKETDGEDDAALPRGRMSNVDHEVLQEVYKQVDDIFCEASMQVNRPLKGIIAAYAQSHGHVAWTSHWNRYQAYFASDPIREQNCIKNPNASVCQCWESFKTLLDYIKILDLFDTLQSSSRSSTETLQKLTRQKKNSLRCCSSWWGAVSMKMAAWDLKELFKVLSLMILRLLGWFALKHSDIGYNLASKGKSAFPKATVLPWAGMAKLLGGQGIIITGWPEGVAFPTKTKRNDAHTLDSGQEPAALLPDTVEDSDDGEFIPLTITRSSSLLTLSDKDYEEVQTDEDDANMSRCTKGRCKGKEPEAAIPVKPRIKNRVVAAKKEQSSIVPLLNPESTPLLLEAVLTTCAVVPVHDMQSNPAPSVPSVTGPPVARSTQPPVADPVQGPMVPADIVKQAAAIAAEFMDAPPLKKPRIQTDSAPHQPAASLASKKMPAGSQFLMSTPPVAVSALPQQVVSPNLPPAIPVPMLPSTMEQGPGALFSIAEDDAMGSSDAGAPRLPVPPHPGLPVPGTAYYYGPSRRLPLAWEQNQDMMADVQLSSPAFESQHFGGYGMQLYSGFDGGFYPGGYCGYYPPSFPADDTWHGLQGYPPSGATDHPNGPWCGGSAPPPLIHHRCGGLQGAADHPDGPWHEGSAPPPPIHHHCGGPQYPQYPPAPVYLPQFYGSGPYPVPLR